MRDSCKIETRQVSTDLARTKRPLLRKHWYRYDFGVVDARVGREGLKAGTRARCPSKCCGYKICNESTLSPCAIECDTACDWNESIKFKQHSFHPAHVALGQSRSGSINDSSTVSNLHLLASIYLGA